MVVISLEKVRREFDDVVAVNDLNLDLPHGSYTVLLGPSGCGKTTTLNMIAGLESVSSGRILFDGQEVQDVPPDRRDVSVVFQSYALYPNRSVFENIAFPLRMQKAKKSEIPARVDRAAGRLGIDSLLKRRPHQLSGGQQQRVALARAIVRTPRAFLLDEPLSNLDAKLRAETQLELKELQLDLKATFVHVTHDQSEAMSLADQLVLMRNGKVQQVGEPREVYRYPANLFVALFLGVPAMNTVEGKVSKGTFETTGWNFPIHSTDYSGPAILGVRSEDLHLSDGAAGIAGKVQLVEYLGAETVVAVKTAFGKVLVRGSADTSLEPDHAVNLTVSRAHLFEAESGRRVATTS